MITLYCPQGSDEWAEARKGIPTASELDALISPTGEVRKGETRNKYVIRKMAERLVGFSVTEGGGGSFMMDQGTFNERYSRPWFEFETGTTIDVPGFCLMDDKRFGCSPDGLIQGEECGLEMKNPDNHTHLAYLIAGTVPKEYIAQVQGSMFATGFPFWYFVSFHQKLPPLCLKVPRDEAYQAQIKIALDGFWKDYEANMAKVQPLIAK